MYTPKSSLGFIFLLALLFTYSSLCSQTAISILIDVEFNKPIETVQPARSCTYEIDKTMFSPADSSYTKEAIELAKVCDIDVLGKIVFADLGTLCGYKHAMFLPDGDSAYIVLDQYYFSSASPLSHTQRQMIFYHELAHLFLSHHQKIPGVFSSEKEIEADRLSGILIAIASYSLNRCKKEEKKFKKSIRESICDLYTGLNQSSDYLSPELRAQEVMKGYESGKTTVQSQESLHILLASFPTRLLSDKKIG